MVQVRNLILLLRLLCFFAAKQNATIPSRQGSSGFSICGRTYLCADYFPHPLALLDYQQLVEVVRKARANTSKLMQFHLRSEAN
jgi:hypothetical protein